MSANDFSIFSNFLQRFLLICKKLCEEVDQIEKSLSDIEPKNGS